MVMQPHRREDGVAALLDVGMYSRRRDRNPGYAFGSCDFMYHGAWRVHAVGWLPGREGRRSPVLAVR